MIRVAIATLGCKTNASESAAIIGGFDPATHCVVPFEEEADIYIINTCTVTGRTDFKSRNLIRKALVRKERDPNVRIVVTGCFAQNNPSEVASLGSIDLIADNQNKVDIAALLGRDDYEFEDIAAAREFLYRPQTGMVERSRAFQKIQDGCAYNCSYCAVHIARGPSRSASFDDVLSQARLFVASGYQEIVLGGVNLGLYRDGVKGLADVVEALNGLPGLELIRLSSLEPQLLSPALLARMAGIAKLCPHFHIPLQSGCDRVLQRMGRRYGVDQFSALIAALRDLFPDAAVGLDVITGFPGETDEEFEQTRNFLSGLDITYLHVFSYSRRKGTPAASLPDQVNKELIAQRTNILTRLSDTRKDVYRKSLIDRRVLLQGVCEEIVDGIGTFLSDHYIRGYSDADPVPGQIIRITPTSLYKDGVR